LLLFIFVHVQNSLLKVIYLHNLDFPRVLLHISRLVSDVDQF